MATEQADLATTRGARCEFCEGAQEAVCTGCGVLLCEEHAYECARCQVTICGDCNCGDYTTDGGLCGRCWMEKRNRGY